MGGEDIEIVTQASATSRYRPILERALGRFEDTTREAREAVYQRARISLVESIRGTGSTASENQIRDEVRRLEEAIKQVEAQFGSTSNPTISAKPPSAAPNANLPSDPAAPRSGGVPTLRAVGTAARAIGVARRRFERPRPDLASDPPEFFKGHPQRS